MVNLQNFLSITPYDVLIVCLELFYIIAVVIFFVKRAYILFDIDLKKLKSKHYNLYSYTLLLLILVAVVLLCGVISNEAQDSIIHEFINLFLYSILSIFVLFLKKLVNSASKINIEINNQIYYGNIAAFIHNGTQILSTALLTSFSIRSFYAENMTYIALFILIGELVIAGIVSIYNIIFLKKYGVVAEQTIIGADWHIALQIATFRLFATISLCTGTTLIFIDQAHILFSVLLWLLVTLTCMVLTIFIICVIDKFFLDGRFNIYLISPEKTASSCIAGLLTYIILSLFVMYMLI